MPTPRPDDSYRPPVKHKVDEDDLVALKNRLQSYARRFQELGEEGMMHCCNEDAEFLQSWYLDYNPDGTYRGTQEKEE